MEPVEDLIFSILARQWACTWSQPVIPIHSGSQSHFALKASARSSRLRMLSAIANRAWFC